MPLNLLGPQETRDRDRCFQGNVPVFITLDAANSGVGNIGVVSVGQFTADQNYFIPWAMLNLSLNVFSPFPAGGTSLNFFKISLAKDPSDGSDYIGVPNQPAYKLPIAALQIAVSTQYLRAAASSVGSGAISQDYDLKPYGYYLNKGETMNLFIAATAGDSWNYYALAQFIAIPTFT